MNNKLIIGGVAIIILIGVVYVFTKTKDAEAPSTVPAENATTVEGTGTDDVSTTEGALGQPTTGTPATTATKPVARPSLPYTATVIYNGEEFIPEEVTIIEGGTVKFVNMSSKKMWIATDNHPTHDRYPVKSETSCSGNAFDQCASVTNGGSWSFTFNRTSTWGYHNHSGATAKGKVIVKTAAEYLEDLTKEKPEWR
jgi:plastocyanin